MTRKLAALVVWACTAWLVLLPLAALYLLVDTDRFAALAANGLSLPIQWQTVGELQWFALWVVTVLYLSLGYAGAWHLRRAFQSFARGHWFDADNSRHVRLFAALLAAQGLARPLHFATSSVILSLSHPPGERVLSISFGTSEAILVLAGLIMWVLADLLVEGTRADAENRQFV